MAYEKLAAMGKKIKPHEKPLKFLPFEVSFQHY